MLEITLNGEPHQTTSANVHALLEELSLQGKRVAVELNREIVDRGSFTETQLSSGDSVEIVHFVGGG